MGSRFRKWEAKAVLAYLFFRHLFLKVLLFWRKDKNSLAKFFTNYREDFIFPVSEAQRGKLADFQRCQACSLCTFSCEAVQTGRAPASFEPKYLLLSSGRSSHESAFFSDAWLPCVACKTCTVQCPNDVPIHDMAEEILSRFKVLGKS